MSKGLFASLVLLACSSSNENAGPGQNPGLGGVAGLGEGTVSGAGGPSTNGGSSGSAGASSPNAGGLGGMGEFPAKGAAPSGGAGSGGTQAQVSSGGRSSGGRSSGGRNSGGGESGAGPVAGASNGGAAGGAPASGGAGSTSAGAGTCVESNCGTHKWACWKMPNPASSPASVPNHQSHTDLGNGAVRDNITCLVWEKANPDKKGNWQSASDRCAALASSGYAGFDDWRLPTRVEMASISDVTLGAKGYPAPFGVTSGYYVTGSFWYKTILTAGGAKPEDRVWGYGTNGFTSNAIVRSNTDNLARCVRGNGPGEAAGDYAVEPPNHYTLAGSGVDATVTDNYTGLTWQATYSKARMPWSEASAYCAAQRTAGLSDWRVSTLNELASTVNEALVAPAINRTVFPNTSGACDETGWFWAAESSKVGGTAWGLSYCDGYTGWNAGASASAWNYFTDAYVRCVR
ncbi:MAG TPA: DUF1566 domain-containing protein [Polyangiaceae bacterium]|nr:DUF1566 domain-containing protein [Polyangiaceae bacterium]